MSRAARRILVNPGKGRNIHISPEVWDHIVKSGRFGETADDVLRRLLLPVPETQLKRRPGRPRKQR